MAVFSSLLFLRGLPTLYATLKRRRLDLICIVIGAFSVESTAHWSIMAGCSGCFTVHIQVLLLFLAPTH